MAAWDTIEQMTIASQNGQIAGTSTWAEHYGSKTMNKLLNRNETVKFFNYTLAMLKEKDELADLTTNDAKKIRAGRYTVKQWQQIPDTLNFLVGKLTEIIDEAVKANIKGALSTAGQAKLEAQIERRAQLWDLVKKVNRAKNAYTPQSIAKALTEAMENGWNGQSMLEAWRETDKGQSTFCINFSTF